MTNKLNALCEVNKKITEIQKKYRVRMSNEFGDKFNFDIPASDKIWMENSELGENTKYKRISLERYIPKSEEDLNLAVFYGGTGCKVVKHNHKEPHMFICLDGTAEFVVQDEPYLISKGQSIYVASNEWHEIKFIEPTRLIIIYL